MGHKINIIGNLGGDPEMRYTPGGQAVTNFSVASSRKYTNNNGEKVEETVWFRCSTWGKLAEVANAWLRKGSKVVLEARLRPDDNGNPRVFNRNDGSAGASFEVTVLEMEIVTWPEGVGNGSREPLPGPSEADDIPF